MTSKAVRVAKLSELLPIEALKEIEALIETKSISIEALKRITNAHKTSLLEKGVDADYLAYMIEHVARTTLESS